MSKSQTKSARSLRRWRFYGVLLMLTALPFVVMLVNPLAGMVLLVSNLLIGIGVVLLAINQMDGHKLSGPSWLAHVIINFFY